VEDKTFELLTKMYSELTDFKKDMNEFRKETKDELQGLKKDVIRIENDHGKKLDALFDGYQQTYEKLQEHDKRFDDVESKLDNLSIRVTSHDSKLEVLEGGRKK